MLWGGRNWSNGTAGRWALLRGAGRGYHVPGSGPRRRAPRSCGLGCRLSWPFRGVGRNRTRTRAKLWLRASASDNLRRGRIKTLTRHRDAAAPTCLRLGLVQACAAGVDRCGDDDDATRVDVEVAAPLCRGVSIRPPPPPSGQPGVVRCPRLRSPLLAPTPITCVVAMPSSLSLRPPTMPCPIAPPPRDPPPRARPSSARPLPDQVQGAGAWARVGNPTPRPSLSAEGFVVRFVSLSPADCQVFAATPMLFVAVPPLSHSRPAGPCLATLPQSSSE